MVNEYIYSPHYDFFINKTRRPAGYDMKSFHFHKKYEIYYEIEGTRRYFIEDNAYLINAGNVVLIGPDNIHKTGSVENMPHARYVLNFNSDYLRELSSSFSRINLLSCFDYGLHVLQIAPKKQQTVELLMARMWESRESDSPQAEALRKMHLADLLLTLDEYAREAKAQNSEQGKIRNETIEAIQSYICAYYTEPLSLSRIAGQFYISEHYLSRLFKKTTGLGVVEYIHSIRLTAAKNMLENTSLKVSQVGEAAGFGTTTHFSRVFKEGTGLSPQQYRKLYRQPT